MKPIDLDFSIRKVIDDLNLDSRAILQKPALIFVVENKDVTMKLLEENLFKNEATIHQALESLMDKDLVRQTKQNPDVKTSRAYYYPSDLGAFIAIGYFEADYKAYLVNHNDNEDMRKFFEQLGNEDIRKGFFKYYALHCLRYRLFDPKGNRRMNDRDAASLYLSFAYQVMREPEYSNATNIELIKLLTVIPKKETISLIKSELTTMITRLQKIVDDIGDFEKKPRTFGLS